MKPFLDTIACCIGILLMFTSCVSQKKYRELGVLKDKVEIDNEKLKSRIHHQESELIELRKLPEQIAENDRIIKNLRNQLGNTEAELADCRKRIEELMEQNRRILTTAAGEKETLIAELNQKELMLEEKIRDLKSLEFALLERERKLLEMNEKIEKQDQKLQQLQQRVSQALMGFSHQDLSVEMKNGRVYVTLSQNLLFPKGSRVVDKEGVKALIKIAEVLRQNQDFQINVEGHTDSDGSEELNWDLSVQRATSIVKILREHGVQANRLTASGRSFFDPVAPNDTEENKSKNRRTEIILSPRLEDLMDIIRP